MNGLEIIKRFGFDSTTEPVSIYPFSPVYKVRDDQKDYIIKKTQSPLKKTKNLLAFTSALKKEGIPVVTPLKKPQPIEEDVYVVYPFIEGYTYSGKKSELIAAGQLLGEIHALSEETNYHELDVYHVFDFFNHEVEDSIEKIKKHVAQTHVVIPIKKLKEKLLHVVSQQQVLQTIGLPHVATPHDYKANNLVMTPSPYLIDPDNAIWIPRVFDLALVLLLFHNELDTAPNRVFTPKEWQYFLTGYYKSVRLTRLEKEQWQRAVEHVFLDEVMWLMAEVEEDWQNEAQQNLFKSLVSLLMDMSAYPLD